MIIKEYKIGISKVPLITPFRTALRSINELESIIVCLVTDDGKIGYGETAPTEAITGDSREAILQSLETIGADIIGKSLEHFESCISCVSSALDGNYNAKSAMEIALYDLKSQVSGKSLYNYLGGEKRVFKTGTTISLNPADVMVEDSIKAISNGFESLKIKLGDDYREDIVRVKKISKAIEGKASLKLDANQGWTPEETVEFLDAIEELEIELLEQPVGRYDLDGMRYIKERSSVPVLADESVFSPEDAKKILQMKACDFVNIKLDKCGGITKALEIADICKEYDIKCMMGCMMEGAVSVGAAAHVASACRGTITMFDLDAPILCDSTPVIGGVLFGGADIVLPEAHGLGIESVEGVEWV